jgi:hypothetical protein
MNVSKQAKRTIVVSVGLVCLAVSAYLHYKNILPLYIPATVACITILAPLISALYIYKAKAATSFAVLAVIGVLFGLIQTADFLATFENFKMICANRGSGHELLLLADSYTCTAPSEADYLTAHTGTVTSNVFVFYPFTLVILVNALHLLWLPVRIVWRRFK